jgi:guanylate kinase
VEWGEYNGNLYGTSVQSVRDVIRTGRVCVLDCSPQAAKYLYTKVRNILFAKYFFLQEFMPYIVFIQPPSLDELKQLYQVHPNRTKTKAVSY